MYTNKVKCAKQKYKNIHKRTDRRRNLLSVPAFVKASQKHEITFISFTQLKKILFIGYYTISISVNVIFSIHFHRNSRNSCIKATFLGPNLGQ